MFYYFTAKINFFSSFALLFCVFLLFTSLKLNCQAKKYILFEHFTNTDCEPCAVQNPIFQSNTLNKNRGNIHHVSYHPNFPSNVDPMYLENESQNAAMENYYNINAVPKVVVNGQFYEAPVSISQQDVFDFLEFSSPIKINVEVEIVDNVLNANVGVEVLNAITDGNWKLKALLVEKEVYYDEAPGINGETFFPNVFRKMLPNAFGLDIDLNGNIGEEINNNFQFEINENWDPNQLKLIAYVQDFDTKEVLNSGSNEDPMWYLTTNNVNFISSQYNEQIVFNVNLHYSSLESSVYDFIIQGNTINSWDVYLQHNNNPSQENALSIMLNGGNDLQETLTFNVNTNDVSNLGELRVLVKKSDEDFAFYPLTFRVLNDCENLIVYNDETVAANLGDSFNNWHYSITDIFKAHISEKTSFVSNKNFVKCVDTGAYGDVSNAFYNAGWAFPALDDAFRNALITFNQNGGNVLMAGQDLGWDVFSAFGNSNSYNNKQFVESVFGVTFFEDSANDVSTLISENNDAVFSWLGQSEIEDAYYIGTSAYTNPDVLKAIDGSEATSIINYNDGIGAAGFKNVLENGSKTVFLGFGIEQIENQMFKREFLKATYWWFNDSLYIGEPTTNYENLIKFSYQMYPNPVSKVLYLISSHFDNCLLYDSNGKLFKSFSLDKTQNSLQIETKDWRKGIYLIQFLNDGMVLDEQKILVID